MNDKQYLKIAQLLLGKRRWLHGNVFRGEGKK
jgi:hypothetical protein